MSNGTDAIQRVANDYASLDRINEAGEGLPLRSPSAIATRYNAQDQLLTRLHAIDPKTLTEPAAVAYLILSENLESLHALRSCRTELLDINHITGWQVRLPPQAAAQLVTTPAERERARRRWASLPDYVETDIANLRNGLASGYFVPKTVALRVLHQIDALLLATPDDSPFAQPARRTDDPTWMFESERDLTRLLLCLSNADLDQLAH